MLSINWDEVPKGYDWAIQDYNGCIKVFNDRPDSVYEDGWQSESGRYIFIAWGRINPNWRSTIVKRPRAKFTFKKQPKKAGLRANVDIKVNKKRVGYISAPNWQTKGHAWRVRFAVKKESAIGNRAGFKWFSVSESFESDTDARQWIKDNSEELSKLDLYFFED